MEQEENSTPGLERAMHDFMQNLPHASECCDEIITEIIIVGSSEVRLYASKIKAGSDYIWDIHHD